MHGSDSSKFGSRFNRTIDVVVLSNKQRIILSYGDNKDLKTSIDFTCVGAMVWTITVLSIYIIRKTRLAIGRYENA